MHRGTPRQWRRSGPRRSRAKLAPQRLPRGAIRRPALVEILGRSQREIATSLFISHNTVKTHLKSVYPKLGVTSRDAAVEQLLSRERAAASADLTRVRSA